MSKKKIHFRVQKKRTTNQATTRETSNGVGRQLVAFTIMNDKKSASLFNSLTKANTIANKLRHIFMLVLT